MASVILWLGNIFTVLAFVMALIIIILAHTLNIKINGIDIKIADLQNSKIQVGDQSITIPIDTAPLITKNIVVCSLAAVAIGISIIFGEFKKNKKLIGLITILVLIGFFISVVILFIESTKLDDNNISELKYPITIIKYVEWAICASGALGTVFLGMSSLYKLL